MKSSKKNNPICLCLISFSKNYIIHNFSLFYFHLLPISGMTRPCVFVFSRGEKKRMSVLKRYQVYEYIGIDALPEDNLLLKGLPEDIVSTNKKKKLEIAKLVKDLKVCSFLFINFSLKS